MGRLNLLASPCTEWQGLIMMLYNQYQRRRMYTRIALGKSSAMDVVAGESSGETETRLPLCNAGWLPTSHHWP